MLILAFLGFTNFAHSLPLNDKILHLVCLCLATTVVYFVFDVEECVSPLLFFIHLINTFTRFRDARRIWFWRHSPLIFTAIICFVFGGVVSEIVQSLLPVSTCAIVALQFLMHHTAQGIPGGRRCSELIICKMYRNHR